MRCGDCKHWNNTKRYGAFPENLKDKYGKCSSKGIAYGDVEDNRTDMLIYKDYEGYAAGFSTGVNFGCVHFKPEI